MNMSFKNFPMVSKVVFGRGSFTQLGEIITPMRLQLNEHHSLFLMDDVFENKLNFNLAKIPLLYMRIKLFLFPPNEEPKTSQVDHIGRRYRFRL